MPKGALEDVKVQTPMEQVREQIRQLEIGVADLRAADVRELLRLRSLVETSVDELESLGRDVRPERTRLETVDNLLGRQGGRIVTAFVRYGGLRAARAQVSPPREHWWWYLDEIVAERMRRTVVRVSALFIGVIVLLLVGNYVLNTFFGMDPEEKEAYGHITLAEGMVAVGDHAGAIERYEQAVAVKPDLAEAWVALAVLYDLQGQETKAEQARLRAERLIADPLRLTLMLAQQYELAREYDRALAYAQQAVEFAPDSAQAYLIRGGVHDSRGERDEALADFEKASELAREAGEDALYVLARTRMGMLLQQGGGIPIPGGGAP